MVCCVLGDYMYMYDHACGCVCVCALPGHLGLVCCRGTGMCEYLARVL